jgi:predicted Zn-dependent protease
LHRGGWIFAALCGALVVLPTGVGAAAEPAGYRVLSLGGYPVRWTPKDAAGHIALRYKIADTAFDQPDAINCKGMRPPDTVLRESRLQASTFRGALAAAFRQWRDIADLAFLEAGPGEAADIIVGEQAEPIGFAFTNLTLARTPSNGIRPIVSASICLNPQRPWKIGYDGNLAVYDLVHTFAHEIGHVIGLDHPIGRAHMMSFRYSETLNGLSEGDKHGAVALYGPSRIRSEIVSAPRTKPDPAQITTTIGRSLSSSPAE